MADFEGDSAGKTIAVRADMDALPIQDQKQCDYASKNPGVIHACGHDCHMAIAIGVVKTLRQLDIEVPGTVRFLFQPSEEATPSGASEMVKAGVMDGVEKIVAFHVDPEVPAGTIGLREGTLTADCSEFRLSIIGKSGHAARPHQAIDSIFTANQVMSSLYQIVGDRQNSFKPAVVSIGAVQGGTKANVLPERVDLRGTIRTVDEEIRLEIQTEIEKRVGSICLNMGATYQLGYLPPIPSVKNNPEMIQGIKQLVSNLNGFVDVVEIEKISMGGEDFSWFLTKAPGSLIRLGARMSPDEVRFLHTSNFDIDERALAAGTILMTMIILKYLLDDNLNFN